MHQLDATTSVTSVVAGVNWTDLRAAVLRFVRSLGVHLDGAEEVADESLCIALQRYRPDFNTEIGQDEAIRRFAFGIAARQVKRWKRDTFRNAQLFLSVEEYEEVEDLMQEVAQAPDEVYHLQEVDAHLRQAMDALPEAYRVPLYLRHCQGRSIHEIAELLDLNENTVKVRLHRARSLMKEQLMGLID